MMYSNEMRINNKVIHSESGYVYDILSIHFEGDVILYDLDPYTKEGVHVDCGIDEIQPLELTEEILFKCGFVFNKDWSRYIYKGFMIEKIGNTLCESRYGKVLNGVHSLQNIYFDLTGQELEINL